MPAAQLLADPGRHVAEVDEAVVEEGAFKPGAAALCISRDVPAFASADPEQSVVSPAAPLLLLGAALATAAFVVRQRTAAAPLVPRRTLRQRPAWGALVVSLFVGAALIAALVDVPFFARLTEHRGSQLAAALVLVEFLVAIPVGAVVGGYATRRVRPAWIAGAGMALACGCFVVMAGWDRDALAHVSSSVVLALAGLGFGLAVAPVNAALLDATPDETHGVASALVVVARMVGMLVGISVLTSWGLRAYHDAVDRIPPLSEVCPGSATACKAYNAELVDAGVVQLSTVFAGAAVCAGLAAVAAVLEALRSFVANQANKHGVPAEEVWALVRDELEHAFATLSLEHRTVLVLVHYVGMTTAEAALAMGTPHGTARSRLHYALEHMRAAIEADARATVTNRGTA